MDKNVFLLSLALLGSPLWLAGAMEGPRVIHFTRQQYEAQNQNWSISQGLARRMFFGNSDGLLMYDGAHWQTFSPPGGGVVRAVACDAAGRIFVGGYAQAGYWAAGPMGALIYHSILEGVEYEEAHREEVWHFLPSKEGMFFQSFSTIYRYQDGKVEVILPPGNLMYIREVEGRILAPVIHQGVYEYLPGGRFAFLPGTEALAGKRVATLLSLGSKGILAATQDDGLFLYRDERLAPWPLAVSPELAAAQINKGIRLSNGNIALGTILDGIYILTPEGELAAHINQESGLQNNTVLALYEDEDGNLWAGLDKGIDLILTNPPLSYFSDIKGKIGAVYTAVLFQGRLFIGTNQGVFSKSWPSRYGDSFRLVPGSQGQAWELMVKGGQLFCGHNSGVMRVTPYSVELLYNSTGVYHILRPPSRDSCLLLATYTGLAALCQDEEGKWARSYSVEGFSASARDAFFDPEGRLWVAHPHRGVYCLRLNGELTEASMVQGPQTGAGLPLNELSASITYWDGKTYVWLDSGRLAYRVSREQVMLVTEEAELPQKEREKWISGRQGALFKVFPYHVEFVHGSRRAFLPIALEQGNERIISLSDSLYLIGTEDGYALFHSGNTGESDTLSLPPPLISIVEVKDKKLEVHAVQALKEPLSLEPLENSLRFLFSIPYYDHNINLRYRLKGFEEEWPAFSSLATKEYTNLPPGDYEFQVQSEGSSRATAFAFVVEPYWYQALWAKLALLAALAFLGRFLYRLHLSRLARQERRLDVQKERELQRQRVVAKNKMLQAKVDNKSRKLADSTMELVRKNEMLILLKKELNQLRKKKEPENTKQDLHKMIRQIDSHLSSEEDWEVFKTNFNQLHDQFFKRLKDKYPELTPGDLRLAAYLKMNLTSKEIAPLLNISLRGVENKRYRLRRKLQLEGEDNLAEFFMQF